MSSPPRPLRIMMMVSATGGNLSTILQLSRRRPDLAQVVLVASDRSVSRALDVARDAGVTTWPGSFTAECGSWRDCRTEDQRRTYRRRAAAFHDRLRVRVENFEREHGAVDLVVLAYHRWIHGSLLAKFSHRMINQHPGDLTIVDDTGRRTLTGLDPVGIALRRGQGTTRTSTFFVDDTEDGGAILVQGPPVRYDGPWPPTHDDVVEHESRQNSASDRPALEWAVTAIAEDRVRLDATRQHPDGSTVVLIDGRPTPLGGFTIDGPGTESPAATDSAIAGQG